MFFNQLLIVSLLYLSAFQQIKSDDLVPSINDEPTKMGLWQLLRPWRGIAMLCFWAILIGICVSFVLIRYCKENAPRLKNLLKRGKYSNYNFVSVYSETEAEQYGGPFGGGIDEEFDTDKFEQNQFDDISIIK